VTPEELCFVEEVPAIRSTPQRISVADTQVFPLFDRSGSGDNDLASICEAFGTIGSTAVLHHRSGTVNGDVRWFRQRNFVTVDLQTRLHFSVTS
jgi:hypothetical protein